MKTVPLERQTGVAGVNSCGQCGTRLANPVLLVATFVESCASLLNDLLHGMKRLIAFIVATVFIATAYADGLEPNRDPAEIIRRTVERARQRANDPNEIVHLYDKRTKVESLNAEGAVTKRKIKLYEVTVRGGIPESRLVAIEGRNLTAKQIAKEDEKLKRRKRAFMKADKDGKELSPRTFVPEDMARRYDVVYLREERRHGRATHVLQYKPKATPPSARNLVERVANELSGTLWIDAEDYELAEIDVGLVDRVKLWGGFLGVLDGFTYSLQRQRSPEGIWHNDAAEAYINARGLFKRLRFRMMEKMSNFRRAPSLLSGQ